MKPATTMKSVIIGSATMTRTRSAPAMKPGIELNCELSGFSNPPVWARAVEAAKNAAPPAIAGKIFHHLYFKYEKTFLLIRGHAPNVDLLAALPPKSGRRRSSYLQS